MARVLLVDPPWSALIGLSSRMPNLGLTSLAAALQHHGHQVAIHHGDLYGSAVGPSSDFMQRRLRLGRALRSTDHPCWQRLTRLLQRYRPDVVGVHTTTPAWPSACQVAHRAKALDPAVTTVCGGPHITAVPRDLVPEAGFDVGIRGEGEHALVQLLRGDGREGSAPIPGVLRPGTPGPDEPQRVGLLDDLDALPTDGDRALLDPGLFDRTVLGSVVTARGCPFPCTYCASQVMWTRKVRYRSPEHVLAEVDGLVARWGLRCIAFLDDTFTVRRERVLRILALLRQRHPGLQWTCTTRADCLDHELVHQMKRSGCIGVAVGLESGSPRVLQQVCKGETLEQIRRGCELLHAAGISVTLFVMIGFPGETEREAWQTLEVARSLKPVRLIGNVLVPYPGSAIYAWAEAQGRLPAGWRHFHRENPEVALWDLPRQQGDRLVARWLAAVDAYNAHPRRLLQRFATTWRLAPTEALRLTGAFALSRLRALRGGRRRAAGD